MTFLGRSGIYRPSVGEGKYAVLIVIKRGSGFPLLFEGTHLKDEGGGIPPVTSIAVIHERNSDRL